MNPMMCQGFQAAGIAAGIKKNKGKDLGLIWSEAPCSVAAVFTKNRVQAAPVVLDRKRVASGVCRAVIVNSGNANCCTGGQGMADALAMTRETARVLDIPEEQVLIASTGVIGQPFPAKTAAFAIPDLVRALKPDGFEDFSEAIMTTDLVPKQARGTGKIRGKEFSVIGSAKGSGMIRPDMATMLCFACTDIAVDSPALQTCLARAVNQSFNRITVDGDTSTNDTVILMADGASGAVIENDHDKAVFQAVLDEVLFALAKMMVKDGEGATKCVEIIVRGGKTDADARMVADTIAHSNLVKTALFGEDANWGRILAASGRAGADFDPEQVAIWFDDVLMVENGAGMGDAAETAATAVLKRDEFAIVVDLKNGPGASSVWTCDFSVEYVRINADYRS